MPHAKKTIENNVALGKLIHWKVRLAFLRTANSAALMLTSNELTKEARLLGMSPIFNTRQLTKTNMHITDFLG